MSVEENKALIRRFFTEIDESPDPGILDEFVAPDFVDHNPSPGCTPDLDGLKQAYAMFVEGSPGYHVIEDMVAEGDKVVTRVTGYGTHAGELFGLLATGREFSTSGIAIHRIADGKIVEHWNVVDFFAVLQQLGALPAEMQAHA